MKEIIKHVLFVLLIVISSQINLMIFTEDFMISAGIISFFIIYYLYKDLNTLATGIFSGILVCLLRVFVSMVYGGSFSRGFISFSSEIFFYITIGIALKIFTREKLFKKPINFFIIPFITDMAANLVEIFIRRQIGIIVLDSKVFIGLILVALARASIIFLILNAFKYYKILVVGKENAEKYKEFLLISSGLRNEIFLMEKNMIYIENLMAEAYGLYNNISNNEKRDSWDKDAINIAKDVHEIKKDYSLVLHGLKNITEIGKFEEDLSFHSIMAIIEDGFYKLMDMKNINGSLDIKLGEDFTSSCYFELISIFRNLLVNSLDAIENMENGEIQFIHSSKGSDHKFEIIDNGSGIRKEDLKYIFSPGFSTKIDYTSGHINRGLGLSIAKDLVEEKFLGTMEVTSKIGEGTNFTILIPKEALEVAENEYISS